MDKKTTDMNSKSNNQTLFLCRPELSGALLNELYRKYDGKLSHETPTPGLLLIRSSKTSSPASCILERQRMVNPGFIPASQLKPIAEETIRTVFQSIIAGHPLWTIHLLTPEGQSDETNKPSRKLEGIWNTLLRLGRKLAPDIEKRFRAPHRLKPGGLVLQLLMTPDGLWHACEPIEDMLNPRPGGFSRMKWDTNAPSRSYLKVEEALDWMLVQPEREDRVIDLGAAPGGWTYAFVKRGCNVLSVDHGPMKLPDHQKGWGQVQHVKKNGITFEPPSDWPYVDWLIADMLIAPGVAQGLLRRWLQSGNANQIICNIKLPQTQPYEAIQPLEDMMQSQTDYHFLIKQLYHDRREITVMAWKKDVHQHPTSNSQHSTSRC